MKIIEQFEQLPKCCQTCKSLLRTIRIPVYHCELKQHFPTKKHSCKREKMRIVPRFKKFLKDHGAYNMYAMNCDPVFNGNSTKIKDPLCYLTRAFRFKTTPQGWSFWVDLCFEWDKVLNKEYNIFP